MNDTRRKMLTEYLGEEWEPFEVKEWEHFTKEYSKEYSAFPVEGVEPTIRFVSRKHRTFTTAQDMVDLVRKMVEREDLENCFVYLLRNLCPSPDWLHKGRFIAWLITDPARTCELIAEQLEASHE